MPPRLPQDYSPFTSRAQFELADFLFRDVKMSGAHINTLMQLWSAFGGSSQDPPFANHDHLHGTIDSTALGDVAWQAFVITYIGPRPETNVPSWMEQEYIVWFRCPRAVLHSQLGNRGFENEMDYSPKKVHHGDERVLSDFMSGDWAWAQAVSLHGLTTVISRARTDCLCRIQYPRTLAITARRSVP